jgi:hypothetical protein
MNYLSFPLNHQNSGTGVEVTLSGVESDVMLLDSFNLQAFKRGGKYSYFGGHSKQSPVHLQVPTSGTWTVVVVPGFGGQVRASVRVTANA